MPRILVVEDSPTQAQQLRLILEEEGFEVEVAPNGKTAWDALSTSAFDVVLSDIMMPGISGYELCRKIKDDPAKRNLPVILLTKLTEPMDIIQGLQCGADNFLSKSCERSYLIGRIRTVLDSKAQRTASKLTVEAEVVLLGKRVKINSDKEQILNLLVTTFEDVLRTNRELQTSQAELKATKAQVDQYARQLENRVRSSEEKYRGFVEQANDAIFLLDAHGKVLEVNHRAEAMLGRPSAEIIGCHFDDFVAGREADHARTQIQQFLADGSIRLDNILLKRDDGRQVCVNFSTSSVKIGNDRAVLVDRQAGVDRSSCILDNRSILMIT